MKDPNTQFDTQTALQLKFQLTEYSKLILETLLSIGDSLSAEEEIAVILYHLKMEQSLFSTLLFTLLTGKFNFSENITKALTCLTKLSTESHETYLNRVKQNPLAIKVFEYCNALKQENDHAS